MPPIHRKALSGRSAHDPASIKRPVAPCCGRRGGRQNLANGAFRFRKLTRPINRRDENMLNHYGKDGAPLDALAPEDDWDLPQPPRQPPRREDLPPPPIKHEQSPASGEIARPVIENVPSRLPSQRGLDRCPAFMVRSALFRAGRIVLGVSHDGPVKGQGSYDLTLSGERLYMRDKQVWQAVISIVKRAPRHDIPIRIELAAIATLMGSSDHCGGALRRIWQSVERLSRAAIQVKLSDGQVHEGKLLSAAYRQEKKYFVELDMQWMAAAMCLDYQFKIDCERRNGLATSLAQWLHDFLSTHQSSPGLSVGYLRSLCGFDGQNRKFPAAIRTALSELKISAAALVADFEIIKNGRSSDAWTVVIVRGPEQPSFSGPSSPKAFDGMESLCIPKCRRVAL